MRPAVPFHVLLLSSPILEQNSTYHPCPNLWAHLIFLGTLNAGHPGGMLPLTERESQTLHHACLPPNLYVADATLFPNSLGNPPILTILALAKRIGKTCREHAG